MKGLHKIKIEWSPKLAYAIGLLATDGNLSPSGRHVDFTSKDREQIENIKMCLGINNVIGNKISGSTGGLSFRVQFGDVYFYQFLESIGITQKKSKTIGKIAIPDKYFFDFLRGHFDGDGTFYSYWDPRWKSSFIFYVELMSASRKHVVWLQGRISQLTDVRGRITKSKNNSVYRLKFAKAESLKLLKKLYYNDVVICLSRKRTKIRKALRLANIKW